MSGFIYGFRVKYAHCQIKIRLSKGTIFSCSRSTISDDVNIVDAIDINIGWKNFEREFGSFYV